MLLSSILDTSPRAAAEQHASHFTTLHLTHPMPDCQPAAATLPQLHNADGQAVAGPSGPTILIQESRVDSSNRDSSTARQMELQLNFTVTPGKTTPDQASSSSQPQTVTLAARILTGQGTYTDIVLRAELSAQAQARNTSAGNVSQPGEPGDTTGTATLHSITSMDVWVDRSKAGAATNTSFIEGGPVPLPVTGSWAVPETALELSVWVDHSVLEVYAMGGLARVTSRIYPEDDEAAWGVAVWAEGGGAPVALEGGVWEMKNMWLAPACDA